MLGPSPFLKQYRSAGWPPGRAERVLAVGRAFLTVIGFLAIYLDPAEPARLAEVTYAVLLLYAAYSLIVLAFVHSSTRLTPRHGLVLHALDVLWTSLLTFVSEGPLSPFFLFFLFVVLAAAYRWGFRETVATAAITVLVFLVETGIALVGPVNRRWFTSIEFELNRTILRVTYLLLTGFLLGYLAEQDKSSRAEMAAIVDTLRLPRVDIGLGGSVSAVARALLAMFDGTWAALALTDSETGRTRLWELDRPPRDASPADDLEQEINANERDRWLFVDPGPAWHARAGSGPEWTGRVLDADTWRAKRCTVAIPRELVSARNPQTVTAVNLGMPGTWQGRIYVFDARCGYGLERSLSFLAALAEHVAPVLSNTFLLARLRAQVGAAERARVARELHDGAIQALFGLELKIEAMRRNADQSRETLVIQLGEVQETVRAEVLALRDLMQALRPIDLENSHQLPDVLNALVERFRRDSGISARFVWVGDRPTIPPSMALELVRILQEALVNVRKHSRAENVLVRLVGRDPGCSLVVEDDGSGLDFEGRLTGDELDRQRLGPAIIKERVRVAGAALAIDSSPGEGTRIEVTFPGATHA